MIKANLLLAAKHIFNLLLLFFVLPVSAQAPTGSLTLADTVSSKTYFTSCDTLDVCNVSEIISHFSLFSYNLDSVRKHKTVPRIYISNFPKELKSASYSYKKQIFIGTTLAAVLKANEEILQERARIERLRITSPLSADDSSFLTEIKRKYNACTFEEMLQKVDILPPSLVIAQGINESGWGTSFFSLNANSIFGMKAPKGTSLPTIKHPVHSFVTYKFGSLDEGIREYMLNINRNKLYKPLRDIRYTRRIQNLPVTGTALLKGLKKYSSRGQAYLNTIRKVITIYDLQHFDSCMLREGKSFYLVARQ